MQARCLAVSMMVGATGAVGAWVVVIGVFFRQSFVAFGPYTTISPTVRILLPSSTRQISQRGPPSSTALPPSFLSVSSSVSSSHPAYFSVLWASYWLHFPEGVHHEYIVIQSIERLSAESECPRGLHRLPAKAKAMPRTLFTKGVIWSIVSLQIGVSHMQPP